MITMQDSNLLENDMISDEDFYKDLIYDYESQRVVTELLSSLDDDSEYL